jgi:hypothetical protein
MNVIFYIFNRFLREFVMFLFGYYETKFLYDCHDYIIYSAKKADENKCDTVNTNTVFATANTNIHDFHIFHYIICY